MEQQLDTPADDGAPKPTAPAKPSVLARALEALDGSGAQEALTIVSLLALCVLIKVLWLTDVDIYWDAGTKWHFARQWAYANDFSHATWSHHMARFGVNIPAFLVQKLLGTGARVYYVWPVA